MANYDVPAHQMRKAKDLKDPFTNWDMLGSDKWKYDFSIPKLSSYGKHYVENKRRKKLWDLMLYCGEEDCFAIASHYGFPKAEHFRQFLMWVYNNVAVEGNWKTPTGGEMMDYFPYEQLFKEWVKQAA